MQYLLAYFLIMATVAAIAVLPQLIDNRARRNGRRLPTAIPADPLHQAEKAAPAQPVLAEVD